MTILIPILLSSCAIALARLMYLQRKNDKRLQQLRDLYNQQH